ncbi:MAG: hypothetical protein JSR91_13370 [Proteobacteria bacterium]|nr:hypothetical protein [Pseudomonadota bacterium]
MAIVAAAAFAGSAEAQTAGSPAPTVHPGTKLSFPPSLGGATLEESLNQGGSVAYLYGINKMRIYVRIADLGRHVPPGSDTPALMNQFTTELNDIAAEFKSKGYGQIERPAVPSSCAYGSVTFRCIVYSVSSTGGRLFSKLLMTGYHDYFLKIRIDWASSSDTQADADRALQSFVSALIH